MNRLAVLLAATALAAAATAAHSQNLVIANARIITGTGQVIEKGSVTVKDGRIAAVTAGKAPAPVKGVRRIDASGMTVIAGYIDDHRHLIYGPPDKYMKEQAVDRMHELLEAGFTTVQSGGDNDGAILELKHKTDSGEIKGPRILASGRVPTAALKDEEAVRAAVRKVVATGVDSIAEVHFPITEPPNIHTPTEQETRNLAAGIDEARKLGVPFQVHTSAVAPMLAALKIGAKKLVHSPHFGWLTDAEAKQVKDAGAWVSSCTGFGAPVFDVFNHDNKPTFRDGKPWPSQVLDGEGRGREAGYKPVNGRTLYDNGVDYGFCTDTTYFAPAALEHEITVLSLVFSPIDLVKVMGQNSADFIDKGKDLGTIETGKLADINILTGNPLDGAWNFVAPAVVIKGGVVMLDRRAELKTVKVLPLLRAP